MNNQCAKFQCNVMPISVFKMMLKIWSKLYFFTCCVSFFGEYIMSTYSWRITGSVTRLTRRVSLVQQEPLPFRSTWVHRQFLVGFMLLNQIVYVYVWWIIVCPWPFFFAIVLSLLIRFTDSDYPFGIFKLFLWGDCCGVLDCSVMFFYNILVTERDNQQEG